MEKEAVQSEASVGLAELIVAVRSELEKADMARQVAPSSASAEGPDESASVTKEPLLSLQQVELEIQFEVTRFRSGEGGIDFKVVSVGGSGSSGSSKTQRLRVLYGPAVVVTDSEGTSIEYRPLGQVALTGGGAAFPLEREQAIVDAVDRMQKGG
jgi:hypothetical protein